MKRLLRGALCASLLLLAVAVLPAASAGAAIPAPGVPTNVTVVAGGSQVTITWSAPVSGPTPTKYQVAGTSASPTCDTVLTTTCVLTFPLTKPAKPAGLTVKYKVRAFNGTKAGAYSPQVTTLFGKPTIPNGITAAPRNGGVLVQWNNSSGGKYPVTSYTAKASNGNTCTSTIENGCTITGLTNGTSYTATVTATNAVGTTAPSAVSSAVLAGSPRAPTAPVVAVAGPGSADVTFTQAGNNGFAISWYTLTAHDLSNPGSPSDGFQWTSPVSPLHIPNLQAGHTYNLTITGTNVNGEGPSSPASNNVTMPTAPGAPTGVTAVGTSHGADVSFTAPADNGSAITWYEATASDVTNPSNPNIVGGNNASPVHVPGLVPGHVYTFTVHAQNAVGFGPYSAPSSNTTVPQPPDAPTGLVAVAGSLSADISFTAPDDHGSPINYYVVTATDVTNPSSPSNGSQWAGGNPIHSPNLVAGDEYTFTVSAANGLGFGPDSAPSNSVVVNP